VKNKLSHFCVRDFVTDFFQIEQKKEEKGKEKKVKLFTTIVYQSGQGDSSNTDSRRRRGGAVS
jgi:hypothetical protein